MRMDFAEGNRLSPSATLQAPLEAPEADKAEPQTKQIKEEVDLFDSKPPKVEVDNSRDCRIRPQAAAASDDERLRFAKGIGGIMKKLYVLLQNEDKGLVRSDTEAKHYSSSKPRHGQATEERTTHFVPSNQLLVHEPMDYDQSLPKDLNAVLQPDVELSQTTERYSSLLPTAVLELPWPIRTQSSWLHSESIQASPQTSAEDSPLNSASSRRSSFDEDIVALAKEYADLQPFVPPDEQRPANPPFGAGQGDVIIPAHDPVLDKYISAIVPARDPDLDEHNCAVVEEFHQQVAVRQKRGPKKIETTPQLLKSVRKAAKEVNPDSKIGLFGVTEKRLKRDVTQQLIAKVQADWPDADPKLIVKKAMRTGHYRRGTSRKPKKPKAKTLSQLADDGIDIPDTRETLKLMAERHPFFQQVLDQMAAPAGLSN